MSSKERRFTDEELSDIYEIIKAFVFKNKNGKIFAFDFHGVVDKKGVEEVLKILKNNKYLIILISSAGVDTMQKTVTYLKENSLDCYLDLIIRTPGTEAKADVISTFNDVIKDMSVDMHIVGFIDDKQQCLQPVIKNKNVSKTKLPLCFQFGVSQPSNFDNQIISVFSWEKFIEIFDIFVMKVDKILDKNVLVK